MRRSVMDDCGLVWCQLQELAEQMEVGVRLTCFHKQRTHLRIIMASRAQTAEATSLGHLGDCCKTLLCFCF